MKLNDLINLLQTIQKHPKTRADAEITLWSNYTSDPLVVSSHYWTNFDPHQVLNKKGDVTLFIFPQ